VQFRFTLNLEDPMLAMCHLACADTIGGRDSCAEGREVDNVCRFILFRCLTSSCVTAAFVAVALIAVVFVTVAFVDVALVDIAFVDIAFVDVAFVVGIFSAVEFFSPTTVAAVSTTPRNSSSRRSLPVQFNNNVSPGTIGDRERIGE